MVKADLVEKLAREESLTLMQSKQIVEFFFDEIKKAIINGERVEIRGFASFSPRKYNGYEGVNPKTGETIKVKPKVLPFFKCGKELKERVDRENLSKS